MMEIELGLIGAFTLMGAAVQLRILKILQFKLKEISREQKRLDDELEAQAASRFTMTAKELAEWEKEHGRVDSQLSGLPLLRDQEAQSPSTEEGSTLVLGQRRSRHHSGISEFMAAPNGEERQQTGALSVIDLGADLESDIPKDFVMEKTSPMSNSRSLPAASDDLQGKRKSPWRSLVTFALILDNTRTPVRIVAPSTSFRSLSNPAMKSCTFELWSFHNCSKTRPYFLLRPLRHEEKRRAYQ